MDPEYRTLLQVELDDAIKANQAFERLMAMKLNLVVNLSRKMPYTLI